MAFQREEPMAAYNFFTHITNLKEEIGSSLLILSLVLLATLFYIWLAKKTPPLPPGPTGIPLLGHLPFLAPDLHRYFAHLARTYGPVMSLRLGTKLVVVITSPSAAKEIYRDHDIIFSNRDPPASAIALTYGGHDIVWSPYGPEWRVLRKLFIREMMSHSGLEAFCSVRRHEVQRAMRDVRVKAGTPVDVGEVVFIATLNVLTGMMWGGTLQGEEKAVVGAKFREVIDQAVELLGKPNISDFFPVVARFDLQGVVKEMKEKFVWLDRIFDSVIDKRVKEVEEMKSRDEKEDILQLLLGLLKEGEAGLSLTKIKALFLDIVVAGTDTSSTTLEWTMAELLRDPKIMRKAREELEEVVGPNNIVEEFHLPKLIYLKAVLKETLRMHPVSPLLTPRRPSQSTVVGGYTIPEGVHVLVNAWAIQRDSDHWEFPLEFRPERFLMEGVSTDYIGNDFHFIPFGSGRRICAGIPLAERMLTYMLASLLHSFSWELPVGEQLDMSDKFGLVLKKTTPLMAVPTPRLSNPELYS